MKIRSMVISIAVLSFFFAFSRSSVGNGQDENRMWELDLYAGYPLCGDVYEILNEGYPPEDDSQILERLHAVNTKYDWVRSYIHGDTPVLGLKVKVPLSVKGNTLINREVVDDPALEISKWLPNWPWSPVYIGNEKIKGIYNVEEVKAKDVKPHRYILSTLDFLSPVPEYYKDLFSYDGCWTNVQDVDVKRIEEVVGKERNLTVVKFYTQKSIFDSAAIMAAPGLRMYSVIGDKPHGSNEADWGWLTFENFSSYRGPILVYAFLYSGKETKYMKVWPGLHHASFQARTKLYHFDTPTHVYYVGPREDLKALVATDYYE